MKYIWIGIFFIVFIWSSINPYDRFTWFLEVIPAVLGFFILAFTYKKFPLTKLVYILILIHCSILMIGGHYTYAEVPLFNHIQEYFNLERNGYDKVGHFVQGFVPAMIAREIFIRFDVVKGEAWQDFIIVCVCLSISAVYEIIEWAVALMTGEDAEAFLGTQGYIWDTQSDMAFAMFGAILALVFLSRLHDKELEKF